MTVQKTVNNGNEKSAVFVDVSGGEYLLYRVTVRGSQPVFTLVDSKTNKLLLSNKDTPKSTSPKQVYERHWPLPADPIMVNSNHPMGMNFLAAIQYDYVVEHRRAKGNKDQLVETLIDITYKSTGPEDWFFQGLSVVTI